MPPGFLDRLPDGVISGRAMVCSSWENVNDAHGFDYVMVPRRALHLDGKPVPTDDDPWLGPIPLRTSQLFRNNIMLQNGLRLATVVGDSMSPLLSHDDLVMVDTSQREPTEGPVYALDCSGRLVFRKVVIAGKNQVTLVPQNKDYEPEPMPAGTMILGRVVWSAG